MTSHPKKLRGLSLLQAVKSELGEAVQGKEISEIELFLAAQQLIDISRSEYIEPDYRDQGQRPGYFSHAVDTAMTTMQSSLWRNELQHWQDDEDPKRFQFKGKDMGIQISKAISGRT
ncbi:hypothetical protein OAN81_03340 [Paracoccaceae bacterium]|nr:hypothetical protein [Paracoccaceae bacterium]